MKKKQRRPSTKTLKRVFKWLEKYGFSIYGSYIDPKSGVRYLGCKDYNYKEVLMVVKHWDNGTIVEVNEDT